MPRRTDNSHVYFIRQVGTGFIKIGRASDPHHRLTLLQVGSPQWLKMVGTVPEVHGFNERAIHKRFEAQWFRGEWHREEGDLAIFLSERLPWYLANSAAVKRGASSISKEWRRRAYGHFPFNRYLDGSMSRIEKKKRREALTLSQRISIGMARIAKQQAAIENLE